MCVARTGVLNLPNHTISRVLTVVFVLATVVMVTLLQNAVHRLHAASAAVGPTSDPSGFVTAVADTADDMNVADIKVMIGQMGMA